MQQPQAAAMQQLPGAEFFESRLQRAQAVPPAERTPEVQAFIESVQLLRSIPELLPVTSKHGCLKPILPLTAPATQERLLQAMLAVARAFYICPKPPVCDIDHVQYLDTHWPPAEQGSYGLLAKLMTAFCGSRYFQLTAEHRLQGMQCARQALQLLSSPRNQQAISCQLQQLAASQGQQLHYAFCWSFGENAVLLQIEAKMGHVDAVKLAEVQAQHDSCCKELIRLEPGNPKSWQLASQLLRTKDPHRAAKMSLRAIQLAQQQGCDLWAADVPCEAVMQLSWCMAES